MFEAGEFVVKPNTGICRIESVVMLDLTGSGEKEYYLLHPVNDDRATLYVTVDADRSRLRLAMSRNEAEDFIKNIKDIEAAWITNDKLREQNYKDALKSNEPEEIVAIIKNMYIRGQERLPQGKKITATDEKYFMQAESILYSELGFAIGLAKENIRELIIKTIEG